MVEASALVEDGIVVDSHDAGRRVPWWSFSKTVLAAASLVLVRDGLVALDTPVGDKPYTLRHLLQHRSGLPDYGGLHAYHEAVGRGDAPWPITDLLERIDSDRLRDTPGEGWDYSNIGYRQVGELIETLTGMKLNAALQRLVLEPLGIGRVFMARSPSDLANVAMGEAKNYHPGWVYHGLLIGSVQDAALLLDRLLKGHLIPADAVQDMLSAHVLPGPVPGRPWQSPGYGLGVMAGETTMGLKVAGHTGGGPGSTIAVYRRTDGERDRTAAFFRTDEDPAGTEERTFELLSL
ncbi:CubicO group peptidase (beta-lactamase class C family) [Microvirga flocculans]|uniref:CubicO group peptidase (Beta-lactamase class C family) n=1 Tax=Microvirga flocculans TaxID=217168 RepID=A0A7W6IHE2_9HYPH|nr:serine hydrolase domain-containing protein [Microvirga flocculans]MBB4041540.1 CubicO group peptidase (beta-lactamase class C family) [Microvirga flocculans]